MSSILDAAKQRAAKQAADLAASIEATAKQNAEMAASLGGISTGMASSSDLTTLVNSSAPAAETKVEYPVGPQGSYKAVRLERFFKANGTRILPVEGYYIPADEEEEKILSHFATQWDMVELVPYETAP